MTQLQDAPKSVGGRPVNPDSLHYKMRHMAVSDDVALFVPAECRDGAAVRATGCVIAKKCGDGRRYTTSKADGGTWVWRIA